MASRLDVVNRLHSPEMGILSAAAAVVLMSPLADANDGQDTIRFNRDIRPILSDHCYQCHGPDSAARKAGLRLDSYEAAVEQAGVIVPRDPAASELLVRIHSSDPDWVMPPPVIKKPQT